MPRILDWQKGGIATDQTETVKMKIPIRGIKIDPRLDIEVDVNVNGSLESAGHRATLFSRLLDEHNIVELPSSLIRLAPVIRNKPVLKMNSKNRKKLSQKLKSKDSSLLSFVFYILPFTFCLTIFFCSGACLKLGNGKQRCRVFCADCPIPLHQASGARY